MLLFICNRKGPCFPDILGAWLTFGVVHLNTSDVFMEKKKICTLKRGWLSVRTIACSQRTHCVSELSSWWWWCLLTCQQCSGRKSHVSSQERIQRGECWLDDSYALPVFLWMEIYWDVARCVLSEERSCVMLQAIFFSEIFICGDEGSKQY